MFSGLASASVVARPSGYNNAKTLTHAVSVAASQQIISELNSVGTAPGTPAPSVAQEIANLDIKCVHGSGQKFNCVFQRQKGFTNTYAGIRFVVTVSKDGKSWSSLGSNNLGLSS